MIDAALIEKCADPSMTVAIVTQFINAAGADDPLTLTIKSNGRLVLVPKPGTPDEALAVLSDYVGKAGVRVGITQMPAGVGITDGSQLGLSLFDSCANLKTGTAMFAKVARIVTQWYESPTNADLLPQMVDDAIFAWKTGYFEGTEVFGAADPGGATFLSKKGSKDHSPAKQSEEAPIAVAKDERVDDRSIGKSEMRIDLSRIGGRK